MSNNFVANIVASPFTGKQISSPDTVVAKKLQPLNDAAFFPRVNFRYYFSYQLNPGEQFFTFSCLAAWLIKRKCNLQVPNDTLNPQDYEDPNVTITAIVDALRKIVNTVEFPPNKLKVK